MPETNSSIVEFKRVEPRQCDELASWIKQYYAYDHIAYDDRSVKTALALYLESDIHGVAYFVNVDEKTQGYFLITHAFDVEFGGRLAIVTDLYFSEAARRLGLGSRSLSFIQAYCASQQIPALQLQVETDNLEAQAFYHKSGFQKLSRFVLNQRIRKPTL